ncbi:MAG: alkylphosphonate utilization protein [Epsilonproteobacteria bacterium (ex Lamellibrachia satsuma)]|nr:MAG: alkylphosphonate utilization protein [Epsilonproteobacteria bacterium (ex Lamellibrachia satsuma)]
MSIDKALMERSGGKCELCGSEEGLTAYTVAPKDEQIVICSTCAASIEDPAMDEKHWNCLHDSMWSTEPAVQVMAFRLLTKLGAQDQLDMMYLEDDVRAWAEEGLNEEKVEPTRDSNGTILVEGDAVSIIKDLVVKGAGFTAKQGTTVKNIRMAPGDPTHIQGRVNGTMIFLKTEFLKKL